MTSGSRKKLTPRCPWQLEVQVGSPLRSGDGPHWLAGRLPRPSAADQGPRWDIVEKVLALVMAEPLGKAGTTPEVDYAFLYRTVHEVLVEASATGPRLADFPLDPGLSPTDRKRALRMRRTLRRVSAAIRTAYEHVRARRERLNLRAFSALLIRSVTEILTRTATSSALAVRLHIDRSLSPALRVSTTRRKLRGPSTAGQPSADIGLRDRRRAFAARDSRPFLGVLRAGPVPALAT